IPDQPSMVRVHVPNPLRDLLALKEPGKEQFPRWTFQTALARIVSEDSGVMIIINSDTSLESGSMETLLQEAYGDRRRPTQPGSEHIQFQQVGVGSQILRSLGVTKMRLMGAPIKYAGLSGFDLEVIEYVVA